VAVHVFAMMEVLAFAPAYSALQIVREFVFRVHTGPLNFTCSARSFGFSFLIGAYPISNLRPDRQHTDTPLRRHADALTQRQRMRALSMTPRTKTMYLLHQRLEAAF